MTECLGTHPSPFMQVLVETYDCLGWDNFGEGRICNMYVEAAKRFISLTSRLTTERWGCQFVHKLMGATHKQWLFRNSYVHCTKLDGLTVQQHEDIFACVKELLLIDPTDLLPRHQHLLEGDFTDLGEGATVSRKH